MVDLKEVHKLLNLYLLGNLNFMLRSNLNVHRYLNPTYARNFELTTYVYNITAVCAYSMHCYVLLTNAFTMSLSGTLE